MARYIIGRVFYCSGTLLEQYMIPIPSSCDNSIMQQQKNMSLSRDYRIFLFYKNNVSPRLDNMTSYLYWPAIFPQYDFVIRTIHNVEVSLCYSVGIFLFAYYKLTTHHTNKIPGFYYRIGTPFHYHIAKCMGLIWELYQFPSMSALAVIRCHHVSHIQLFTSRLKHSNFAKSEQDKGRNSTSSDHSTPWTSRSNPTKEDSMFKRT